MIAYDRKYLRNHAVVSQSQLWFAKKLLSKDQILMIIRKYIVGFYLPKFFVRICLFVFTGIGVFTFYGLLGLLFSIFDTNNYALAGFTFFYSLVCLFVLEIGIKYRGIFRSGVDDFLLYAVISFMVVSVGIAIDYNFNLLGYNTIGICIVAELILVGAVLRFLDRLVTCLLVLNTYLIVFLMVLKIGPIAKQIMPFVLMVLSCPIYFYSKKVSRLEQSFFWKQCLNVFEWISLIVFYLSGNYFVVRESGVAFFELKLVQGQDIPFALFFYFFTANIPLVYVFLGLKNKDKGLLWVGLILVVIAALSFKHYFSLGHPEYVLSLAGLILIVIAYFSYKFLRIPRFGITINEDAYSSDFLKANVEALVIAQSLGNQTPSIAPKEFGGGDFGGGGSGGRF